MKKSSKRQRGPVTEDIPERPHEMSIEYRDSGITESAIPKEALIKNLIECPAQSEPLEPEEVGIQIYVYMPKHSKSARKLMASQFKAGLTKEAGVILLPDGQLIKIGATIKTEMRPELKVMLRDGVFLAGKAPRRS